MDLNEKEIDGTLLLRYINETATREEREQVDAWLAEDAANSDTLLQMARICHARRTRLRISQRNPHRALTLMHQRMAQRTRRIVFRRLAVAASLLIGILGIASLVKQNRQTEISAQMIIVYTNAGMRSHLTLPDGTAVHLNAGSTLEYPSQYGNDERRVHLSGEAYFKVAPDNERPFVVSSADGKLNIIATGTEFNVQAYEKDGLVQTTLIEGSVQLGIQGKKGRILLTPSEQMTYDITTDQVFLEKTNTAQITAWMNGCLIFKDTPMPEVLRQLTHFYSVDFNVQDGIIRDYTFTGTFENRPLFQILDILNTITGFHQRLYKILIYIRYKAF